jgi:hypothetical protein
MKFDHVDNGEDGKALPDNSGRGEMRPAEETLFSNQLAYMGPVLIIIFSQRR